jgi:catechol 2,3-dioxygenase-like lactoylglutathione lyase family enzyme
MLKTRGFHDVTIQANNPAELALFYERLGFQRVAGDGENLFVFAVGDNELALHSGSQAVKAAITLSILVDDLEATSKAIAGAGLTFESPRPMRPGLVGISVTDPNGNTIEFLGPAAHSSHAGRQL